MKNERLCKCGCGESMEGTRRNKWYKNNMHQKVARKARKLAKKKAAKDKRDKIFRGYHKDHPKMWLGIELLTLAQVRKGVKYIFVRHNMRAIAMQMKIGCSDGFSYYYSRMLIKAYPDLNQYIRRNKK